MASKRKISQLWNHFAQSEENPREAFCNYCGRKIAISISSIGSLKRHLVALHPNIELKPTQGNSTKTKLKTSPKADDSGEETLTSGDLWTYFERDGAREAHCVVCTATVPSRVNQLKEHLRKNHWKLYNDVVKTEDSNEKSDDEADDKVYTELVYLDKEFEATDVDNEKSEFLTERTSQDKKAAKRRHSSPKLKKKKKRTASSSSDEPVLKKQMKKDDTLILTNKQEEDDEIDRFGKYITCLLKQVPKKVCTKLQMDIVALIMSAKLAVEINEETKMDREQVPINENVVNDMPILTQTNPADAINTDVLSQVTMKSGDTSPKRSKVTNASNVVYTPVTFSHPSNTGSKIYLALQHPDSVQSEKRLECSPIKFVVNDAGIEDLKHDAPAGHRAISGPDLVGANQEISTPVKYPDKIGK